MTHRQVAVLLRPAMVVADGGSAPAERPVPAVCGVRGQHGGCPFPAASSEGDWQVAHPAHAH